MTKRAKCVTMLRNLEKRALAIKVGKFLKNAPQARGSWRKMVFPKAYAVSFTIVAVPEPARANNKELTLLRVDTRVSERLATTGR